MPPHSEESTDSPDATRQIVVVGLPKSANVYVRRVFELTIGCRPFAFCTRGFGVQRLMPDVLFEFMAHENSFGGQHLDATPFHLNLLAAAGVRKIGVLVRDPRDALISWWHHLESQEVLDTAWHDAVHAAAGLQAPYYRSLTPDEKMADLIDRCYPAFVAWIAGWADAIDRDARFSFHLVRYEDVVGDQEGSIKHLFAFFGHQRAPIMPPVAAPIGCRLDPETHFRRGVVGSHRDECPAHLKFLPDNRLFQRFGWMI